MPNGKPAGVRCVQLTGDNLCAIFGQPDRPAACGSLRALVEMCGSTAAHALDHLHRLERLTVPGSPA